MTPYPNIDLARNCPYRSRAAWCAQRVRLCSAALVRTSVRLTEHVNATSTRWPRFRILPRRTASTRQYVAPLQAYYPLEGKLKTATKALFLRPQRHLTQPVRHFDPRSLCASPLSSGRAGKRRLKLPNA